MKGRLRRALPMLRGKNDKLYSVRDLRDVYVEMLRLIKAKGKAAGDTRRGSPARLVELTRLIAEMVVYGEQNDEPMFEYFSEKNMIAMLVDLMRSERGLAALKVQVLQTLSILVQNVEDVQKLYYLLSNNFVNALIDLHTDTLEEEVLHNYAAFIKTLGLRLDSMTVQFFFDWRTQSFPLYAQALRLLSAGAALGDPMVQMAALTTTLTVLKIPDPRLQAWLSSPRALGAFFDSLRNNALKTVADVLDVLRDKGGVAAREAAVVSAVDGGWQRGEPRMDAAAATAVAAALSTEARAAASRLEGKCSLLCDQFMSLQDVLDAMGRSPNAARMQHGLRHYALHSLLAPLLLDVATTPPLVRAADDAFAVFALAADCAEESPAGEEQLAVAEVEAAEAAHTAIAAQCSAAVALLAAAAVFSGCSDTPLLHALLLLMLHPRVDPAPLPRGDLGSMLVAAQQHVASSRDVDAETIAVPSSGPGFSRGAPLAAASATAPRGAVRGALLGTMRAALSLDEAPRSQAIAAAACICAAVAIAVGRCRRQDGVERCAMERAGLAGAEARAGDAGWAEGAEGAEGAEIAEEAEDGTSAAAAAVSAAPMASGTEIAGREACSGDEEAGGGEPDAGDSGVQDDAAPTVEEEGSAQAAAIEGTGAGTEGQGAGGEPAAAGPNAMGSLLAWAEEGLPQCAETNGHGSGSSGRGDAFGSADGDFLGLALQLFEGASSTNTDSPSRVDLCAGGGGEDVVEMLHRSAGSLLIELAGVLGASDERWTPLRRCSAAALARSSAAVLAMLRSDEGERLLDTVLDGARAVLPRRLSPLREICGRESPAGAHNKDALGASAMRGAVNSGEILRCIAAAGASARAANVLQRIGRVRRAAPTADPAADPAPDGAGPRGAADWKLFVQRAMRAARRFALSWEVLRAVHCAAAAAGTVATGETFLRADGRLAEVVGGAGGTPLPAGGDEYTLGGEKVPLVHALVLSGEPLRVAERMGALVDRGGSPPSVQATCVLQRDVLVLLLLRTERSSGGAAATAPTATAGRKVLWATRMDRLRVAVDERGNRCLQLFPPPGSRGQDPILLAFDTEKSCRVVKRHVERQRARLRDETRFVLEEQLAEMASLAGAAAPAESA